MSLRLSRKGPPDITVPSWVDALTPGQWYEIPNSAPNAVVLNHSVIDSWGGAGIDTRSSMIYLVANGGHSDYAGNEVYKFDTNREHPVWTMERASTHNGVESCVAFYASGDPCSRHT